MTAPDNTERLISAFTQHKPLTLAECSAIVAALEHCSSSGRESFEDEWLWDESWPVREGVEYLKFTRKDVVEALIKISTTLDEVTDDARRGLLHN